MRAETPLRSLARGACSGLRVFGKEFVGRAWWEFFVVWVARWVGVGVGFGHASMSLVPSGAYAEAVVRLPLTLKKAGCEDGMLGFLPCLGMKIGC